MTSIVNTCVREANERYSENSLEPIDQCSLLIGDGGVVVHDSRDEQVLAIFDIFIRVRNSIYPGGNGIKYDVRWRSGKCSAEPMNGLIKRTRMCSRCLSACRCRRRLKEIQCAERALHPKGMLHRCEWAEIGRVGMIDGFLTYLNWKLSTGDAGRNGWCEMWIKIISAFIVRGSEQRKPNVIHMCCGQIYIHWCVAHAWT